MQRNGLWERREGTDVYVYTSKAAVRGHRDNLTAGEILQRLSLQLAVHDASKYPYVCQLLAEAFQHVYTPYGVYASGSTERALLNTVEQASICLRTNGRFYRAEYYDMVRSLRASFERCPSVTPAIRRRAEDAISSCNQPVHDEWAQSEDPMPLEELPEDVLLHVLVFLPDHVDVLRLSETCRCALSSFPYHILTFDVQNLLEPALTVFGLAPYVPC